MSREGMHGRVFELSVGSHGPGEIEVVGFHGQEEVSRPFSFDVTFSVACADPARFSADILGAGARLTIHGAGGAARRIQGVVHRARADALDVEKGLAWFTLRLVPRLRLLGHRKNSRIFQDQSVPAIVTEILRESGVEHAWKLAHAYGKRAYCVQYQETDLHFVTRLLAEEGIFYFIEDPSADAEASEVIVCADIAAHYPAIDGEPRLPFREAAGMAKTPEPVHGFGLRDRIRPGAALVKYFDFRRPSADLTSSAEAPRPAPPRYSEAALCIDDYQFELEEEAADPQAADLFLEQHRATKTVGLGQSRCRRLAPGRRFVLEDHPDHALNKAYAVLRVEHEGAASPDFRADARSGERSLAMRRSPEPEGAPGEVVYRNRFSCLPADVAARPRRPRRRLQQVMETATVVGPEGEEIHTDEYGRIKVQFHWDRKGRRDEKSSCWIRTMQPWAGASWGFQFIPRVGMEVVVMFAGGDTDRPMVSGCAYNGVMPPPYPLPMNKTRSGIRTQSTPSKAGSNELMFEDAASQEQIYLHAQRDFDEVVEHDHRRTVRGDEIVGVEGGRETTIAKDHVRTVLGNEVVTIEKNLVMHIVGKQIIHVDGGPDAQIADQGAEPGPAEQKSGPEAPEITPEAAAATLEQILEAKLMFQVAQLPRALQSQGDELLRRNEAALAQLSALRKDVDDLRVAAGELRRRAREEGSAILEAGPGPALAARAVVLEERAAQAHRAAADALAQVQAMADERLAGARDTVRRQLEGAMVETSGLEQAVRRTRDSIQRAATAPGAGEAGESGSGRGGGGATTGFKDEALSFLGPPDENGLRIATKVPGGSRMVITGGGEIDSEQGFRIKAAGCSLEMKDGIISLTGAQVIITAGKVTVTGDMVQVQGSEVAVKGAPIRLN